MKTKRMLMCVAALGMLSTSGFVRAEGDDQLLLHMKNGSGTQEFSLAGLQKMTFGTDAFTLITAGSSQEFNYDEVGMITFFLEGSGLKETVESDLLLYPNPATDYVSVQGWDAQTPVQVLFYSADGRCCLSVPEWNGEPIQVSGLAKGLYVVKIDNNVFKFWKL